MNRTQIDVSFEDEGFQGKNLYFNIEYLYDKEIEEWERIGSFTVFENGALLGEIDDYLVLYNKPFIEQAKNIMLQAGLSYIVGNDSIFTTDGSIDLKFAMEPNHECWTRAIKYVEQNKLLVDKTNTPKIK